MKEKTKTFKEDFMFSGKRPIRLIIICLAVCSLAMGAGGSKKDLPDDLTLVTIDGKRIEAQRLKENVLVMTIGSSWCPECKKEAREIEKAHQSFKDKGVIFISVLGKSTDNQIRDFVKTYELTHPVCKDNGLADSFGVRVIPQTFIFSRGGTFVKRIMGEVTHRELRSNIEPLLAN